MKIIIDGENWTLTEQFSKLLREFAGLIVNDDIIKKKTFSEEIEVLKICLSCRIEAAKQRKRILKLEKMFFFDVIFDYETYKSLLNRKDELRKWFAKHLYKIPEIIRGKKFKDFDIEAFEKDFAKFMEKNYYPKEELLG